MNYEYQDFIINASDSLTQTEETATDILKNIITEVVARDGEILVRGKSP